ncbi:MAG: response regulator transcription factor [Clostridiaceae bacterium]|nr:response regulator transcription factor [Clostridiaceae bacterium]
MKMLIVDDHPMVRKGLVSTLSAEENVEEIKESSGVEESVRILSSYDPDIAILDLRLGKEDGLDIVTQAREMGTKTKFLILTSSSKKEDFIRAQKVGVDGFILKEAFAEDIIYAIHVVARGKKFYDPEITQSARAEDDELRELTSRERDVLLELGKGLNNIQIANRLYISENTVKKHIGSIFSKLGINHRVEAALYVNNSISLNQ